MRLFIAIEIPVNVQKQIKDIQNKINFTLEQAKYTSSKETHITLKFLGEIPEIVLSKIKESLKNISFEKFKAKINQNASFPNENYLRVAWIIAEPQKQLTQLHQEIEKQLAFIKTKKQGFLNVKISKDFNKTKKTKQEEFIPHITIARFKYVRDRKSIIEQIKKLKITAEWEVLSFKLLKSTLTPKGPIYECLEDYELKNQSK